MKALSLWQPWASLIATGAKTWETRSWPTAYRGPLLICASKGGLSKTALIATLCIWPFQGGLAPLRGKPLELETVTHWAGITADDLPFGTAVCIVDLMDCRPTGSLTLDEIGTDAPFGDFTIGRYAWKLENVRIVGSFEVRGKQRLFTVPDSVIGWVK